MPNFSVSCTAEMQVNIVKMAMKPSKVFKIGYEAIMSGDSALKEEIQSLKIELENSNKQVEELKETLFHKNKLANNLTEEILKLKEPIRI